MAARLRSGLASTAFYVQQAVDRHKSVGSTEQNMMLSILPCAGSKTTGAPRPSSPAQVDSLSPVQAALVFGFYAALEQTMACAYYGSLTRHKPPFTACTFYRFNRKVCTAHRAYMQ